MPLPSAWEHSVELWSLKLMRKLMREMMIEQSRNIHALNLEVSQPHRFLNPASLGAEAKATAQTLHMYREHLKAKAKAKTLQTIREAADEAVVPVS